MTDGKQIDLKALKSGGVMKMRDNGLFSIRLGIVGGYLGAEQLKALGELATKYGRGEVHLTTRQGVEIPFVPLENIDPLRAELSQAGLEFGQCGPRVRTIVACLGTACCHGLIDAQQLARIIFVAAEKFRRLPHKFKIAITGCPNSCAKPQENDFGIMGIAKKVFHPNRCTRCSLCLKACRMKGALTMDEDYPVCAGNICIQCGKCALACPTDAWEIAGVGYAVYIGGKMGRVPRSAQKLPIEINDLTTLLQTLDRTAAWYSANGSTGERFGDTIDRIGFHDLVEQLKA